MSVQIYSSRHEGIREKAEKVITFLVGLLEQGYSISSSCSFGKDSQSVLVLFLEALKRAKAAGIPLPPCFVSHSNTLIENPAMDSYAGEMLYALECYIEREQLPVQIVVAEPSVAASFFYATVGRGKLPRFVDAKSRECSVDWKVRPQQKALKKIRKAAGDSRKLVVLVGTRISESASRAERMTKAAQDRVSLVGTDHPSIFSNAPIADWDMTDVWELLMACDANRGGIFHTYVDNFEQTLELYKAGNDGVCAVIVGDGGHKAACGSRFGCAVCTVSGDRDKSMEAMISSNSEHFGYLKGINKLRNFLVRTQFDFSRREWLQRGISDVGYVALSPDNYSSEMRREILRYLLTLDIREEERSEEHSAALIRGDIPDTPQNRKLAHPQFEWVTPKNLLAIDFAWGIHGVFQHAFPALREWYEIRHLGRRYDIPDVDEQQFPRKGIPEKRYFFVGTFDHPWKVDGLRNLYSETVNPYRHPERPAFGAYKDPVSGETRRVTYFEETDELDINGVEANLFLLDYEELYFDTLCLPAQDGVTYLLDKGLVKIGRGQIALYDRIARRSQFWSRLQEKLNVQDVEQYAMKNSISKNEHDQMLAEFLLQRDSEAQCDLFDFAEAS